MDWLNYHHLLYFWTMAREGSVTRACEQLHLAQPTISSQLTASVGLFAAPSAIEEEIGRQYRVRSLGELPEVRERYYAISAERKLKHPAVVAISEAARQELFV